jgi:hypothetical protein
LTEAIKKIRHIEKSCKERLLPLPHHVDLYGNLHAHDGLRIQTYEPIYPPTVRYVYLRFTPFAFQIGAKPLRRKDVMPEPERFMRDEGKHSASYGIRQKTISEPVFCQTAPYRADRSFCSVMNVTDLITRLSPVSFRRRKIRSDIHQTATRFQNAVYFLKGMPHARPRHSSERPGQQRQIKAVIPERQRIRRTYGEPDVFMQALR